MRKGLPAEAARKAAKTAPAEIWIRRAGTRRQAFWRHPVASPTWQDMQVPAADKALRIGSLTIGPLVDAPVVSRETEATHPAAAAFAAQAQRRNRQLDAICSTRAVA